MADSIFELNAKLVLDTSQYDSALDDAARSSEQLTTSLENASGASEGAQDAFDELASALVENASLTDEDAARILELCDTLTSADEGSMEFQSALGELSSMLGQTSGEAGTAEGFFSSLVSVMSGSSSASEIMVSALNNVFPGLGDAAQKAAEAAVAVAKFVNEMTQAGDAVDKGSQKMGVSAGEFQRWSFIAEHCGTTISSVKTSMRTLTSAVENGSDAFNELGLDINELRNMSQEELFATVISSLQSMESSSKKTALAQKLLGRGSQELAAILNLTSGEMSDLTSRYDELNGAMSDNMVEKSAELQDALTNLSTAWEGIKGRIAEFIITALPVSQVIEGIATAIGSIGNLDEIDKIHNEMRDLDTELEIGAISQADYDRSMASLNARIAELEAGAEGATDSVEGLDDATEDLSETSLTAAQRVQNLAEAYEEAYADCVKRVQDYWGTFSTASTDFETSVDEMTSAVQSQIDWITNYQSNLEAVANSGIEGIDGLLDSVSAMGTDGAAYAQALADSIKSGDTAAVEGLITKMGELTSAEDGLAELQSAFTDAFAAMVSEAEGDMEAIQAVIDSLHGTTVHNYIVSHYLDAGSRGVGANGNIGGEYAGGLDYVPSDMFGAYLHRGEAVLTAEEAAEWRAGNNGFGGGVTTNIYAQDLSEAQIDYITEAVNRRLGGR